MYSRTVKVVPRDSGGFTLWWDQGMFVAQGSTNECAYWTDYMGSSIWFTTKVAASIYAENHPNLELVSITQ